MIISQINVRYFIYIGANNDQLDTYPQIKKLYLKAFDKMIEARREAGLETDWKTAEEVMDWWMEDKR